MGSIKLLKASAGSGKTFMLAYEYVKAVIMEPMRYRHILAVTFTNKATEEMKRRIISELNDLAIGKKTKYLERLEKDSSLNQDNIRKRALAARANILHDYSNFAILTIDKFFQRIIRSFIKELGIDLNFNLELQTETLLSSAVDAIVDDIPLDVELKRWITAFVEEKIAQNKKWDIKSGLIDLGGEVFREGYKASSSTNISKKELAEIVAKANVKYSAIVSALRTEAEEAIKTMNEYGLEISDFPYKEGGFAGYFAKIAEGNIEPYGLRVVKALESDENWYSKKSPRKDDIQNIIPKLKPALQNICEIFTNNEKYLNSVELLRENYRNFALLADLSQKIERICTDENIMPISETNIILNKLISNNDAPFIFEKAGNHFTRFMIDEFQDTSAMQWENFIPLLHNALSQDEGSPVLLVGDVKQSIYRWRGGDWRILAAKIEREFDHIISHELKINYRSSGNVINFNNNLIGQCIATDNTTLNNMLDDAASKKIITTDMHQRLYSMLAEAYKGHEQETARNDGKGYVNITSYDRSGTPPIISRIEELQERGFAPGDISILVRYNAHGSDIANMLLKHKSRNPDSKYKYDVVTQEALTIGKSPVAGFVIACMKIAVSCDNALNRTVYNRWLKLPLEKTLQEEDLSFFNSLILLPPEEAFENIMIRYRLDENKENIAYLQALHSQIISFCSSAVSDIPLFIKWWEEKGAGQSVNLPQNGSAITITTIHKAKGLEYNAVIIPYCDWSLAPSGKTIVWSKNDDGELDNNIGHLPIGFKDKMRNSSFADSYFNELVLSHVDNINTFYVAATRAMEELHIIIPNNAGKTSGRISSLIEECVTVSGNSAYIGNIRGKATTTGVGRYIEFGNPVYKTVGENEVIYESVVNPAFGTYPISGRLKLRYNSEKYLDEDPGKNIISPRDYGILMHRIFEKSTNFSEIEKNMAEMRFSGIISDEESQNLTNTISDAFLNKTIKSWFYNQWDTVRNENDIIIPGETQTKRPDRVMTKGDKAVVVDYKFGLNRSPSHSGQIKNYMKLLRAMGYSEVEGFVWYVSIGEVEKLDLTSIE